MLIKWRFLILSISSVSFTQVGLSVNEVSHGQAGSYLSQSLVVHLVLTLLFNFFDPLKVIRLGQSFNVLFEDSEERIEPSLQKKVE